jgi:hypothetical protein
MGVFLFTGNIAGKRYGVRRTTQCEAFHLLINLLPNFSKIKNIPDMRMFVV